MESDTFVFYGLNRYEYDPLTDYLDGVELGVKVDQFSPYYKWMTIQL